ncbi:hypothetical protein Patl1_10565 [Pistacia atlantica]|uniref:Uncharacterized protein n=1 Tax=Pistacia atlantica TaxID=434234 RepID=A0ACC1A8K4_9ROSI|nr:hypothetical protein Patl1_10565 [Pistacia atlantica]
MFIILMSWSSQVTSHSHVVQPDVITQKHEEWVIPHACTYKDLEKEMRFKIFKENLDFIENFYEGSCCSFSSTGSLETLVQIKTGNLVSLSEQQLVDCFGSYRGNMVDAAFRYIVPEMMIAHKIPGIQGKVDVPCSQIHGCESVPSNNDEALLKGLTVQPVSILLREKRRPFRFY